MSGQRRMSVNIKKIKGNTQVNRLVQEYGRTPETADRYDDGHRMIDTSRTADNVVLLAPPDDYDRIRRERIEEINERRAGRADNTLKVGNKRRALSKAGELQAEASRNAAKTRKLRSDTVDTLGIVVQMPPDMADVWTREQQTQFFRDALSYMQEHPEEYGHIDAAVIHYDESSPHMQCLASTLDMDNLKSAAKEIVGNKTKMSDRQTHIAEAMQAKGWNVQRGVKRVNNPEYRNFRTDMERLGIEVNRHNDVQLLDVWRQLKQEQADLKQGQALLKQGQADLKRGQTQLKQDQAAIAPTREALDARQRAQDARQRAQDARDRTLDAKDRKSLKTANTASERLTELQGVLTDLQAATQDGKETVKDIRAARQLRHSHGMTALQQARELDQQTDRARQAADDARAWIDSLNDLQGNDKGLSL